jgi:hypothetical protein
MTKKLNTITSLYYVLKIKAKWHLVHMLTIRYLVELSLNYVQIKMFDENENMFDQFS